MNGITRCNICGAWSQNGKCHMRVLKPNSNAVHSIITDKVMPLDKTMKQTDFDGADYPLYSELRAVRAAYPLYSELRAVRAVKVDRAEENRRRGIITIYCEPYQPVVFPTYAVASFVLNEPAYMLVQPSGLVTWMRSGEFEARYQLASDQT